MHLKEKGLAILKMLAVLFSYAIPVIIITGMILGFLATSINRQGPVMMIISGVVSLLFTLLAGFVISKIYKINTKELGMLFTKHWLRNYGIGIGIGTLSLLMVWLLSVVLGGYSITVNNVNQTVLINILINFVTMLMVGYYEEVLTRGLMTFVGAKNSKLFNAILVALIFSLLHLLNNSFSILPMINTFLVAIAFSMLTWISGDLWVAIGYHAFWNFTMGSILGVPISGVVTDGLLISSPNSAGLINGGAYGLEGSLICTVFLLTQIAFIYVFFIKEGKINKEPVASWLA